MSLTKKLSCVLGFGIINTSQSALFFFDCANLLGLVNAFCKPDISVMIGFQIIILLLWCRPRRDRQLAKQLAKIEIQLDLIQSKLSAKHEKQKAGRRYTMDFASPDRPTNTKKGQKGSKKSHRAITEQINENVDNVFIES